LAKGGLGDLLDVVGLTIEAWKGIDVDPVNRKVVQLALARRSTKAVTW
jgi:hypothetical protein